MKLVIGLFLLIVAGTVGWYFYCVNPVMDDFHAAVKSGKPEAILPFMDVPELKKNTAKFIHARFDNKDNPAANMTDDQVQQMVDNFVTPANILLILKGVKIEPGKGAPDQVDDKVPHPIVEHYSGPDVYAMDIFLSQVQTPDNMVSLFFLRNGWFDWKLSQIQFSWN